MRHRYYATQPRLARVVCFARVTENCLRQEQSYENARSKFCKRGFGSVIFLWQQGEAIT